MTTRQAGYGIQPNSALEGPVRPKAEKKRASHFTEALSSGTQDSLGPLINDTGNGEEGQLEGGVPLRTASLAVDAAERDGWAGDSLMQHPVLEPGVPGTLTLPPDGRARDFLPRRSKRRRRGTRW